LMISFSFTAHPTIRKQFLACVWWNQKSP